jgi:hypothetical protein
VLVGVELQREPATLGCRGPAACCRGQGAILQRVGCRRRIHQRSAAWSARGGQACVEGGRAVEIRAPASNSLTAWSARGGTGCRGGGGVEELSRP